MTPKQLIDRVEPSEFAKQYADLVDRDLLAFWKGDIKQVGELFEKELKKSDDS